jgi:hypothetical protein
MLKLLKQAKGKDQPYPTNNESLGQSFITFDV